MAQLTVAVVTPQKQVTRGEVDQVVAPSVLGQVGILPSHRPLLADLVPGVVELHSDGKAERYAISGGFIEVDRDTVTLAVETAERPADIDVPRAQAALADAESQMKKLDPLSEAYGEQRARAERARVRVRVGAS